MNLRGDFMDFPYSTDDCALDRRGRKPVSLWLMVALIGIILGGAALAASLSTDTRDFAARHGTVLTTRAL
jgi:hypothetical protein